MNGKIFLSKDLFSRDERVLFESGSLLVTTFKYSNGSEALKLKNEKLKVLFLSRISEA